MWTGVGLGMLLLLLWRLLGRRRRRGKVGSPWLSWDQIHDPPPLETDAKRIDDVIAKRFKPSEVANEVWDVIIIGSGIGALVTGALLCRAGYKVLILEKHEKAGGCTHTFK